MLARVGTSLQIGSKIFHKFAAHADELEADETAQIKLKQRMRHLATDACGRDWRDFFLAQDEDGSGSMSWSEFYRMCRHKLHLTEHDNILRTFFARVDADLSGELTIEELIHFVGEEADQRVAGVKLPDEAPKADDYAVAYEIDVVKSQYRPIRSKQDIQKELDVAAEGADGLN